MTRRRCLTESELTAFQLGNLPEAELDAISDHLEGCARCEQRARRLDSVSDPFLESLRLCQHGMNEEKLGSSEKPDCWQENAGNTAPSDPSQSDTDFGLRSETGRLDTTVPHLLADNWPKLPDYEVLGILGRGAMGTVYKARQVRLNRIVALKQVRSPVGTSRFHVEAEALAQLQHPNIVQVFAVEEPAGCPLLVLECIDGPSLEDFAAGRPQPVEPSARIVERIARAVDYAHKKGIIHRDLKPANILLEVEGRGSSVQGPVSCARLSTLEPRPPERHAPLAAHRPKITDFGIARLLQAESRQTRDGTVIGTPEYMAPEQAAAENGHVGPATDVYSLGVILYELLTGHVPLQGADTLDTLLRVHKHEPTPLRRLRPDTPRDLEAVCLKCLEKSPERRYATAAALADDLQRYLNREPVLARPVTATGRTWRWCRRNPVVAALSAGMVLLLVTATISSVLAAFHFERLADDRSSALTEKDRALHEVTRAKHRTERLLEEVRGAQRQATEQLYESSVAKADALRWSGRLGQRLGSIESLRLAASLMQELDKPPSEVLRLRNAAINSLTLADLSMERTWRSDFPLGFGPRLKRYIRLEESGDVLVFEYAEDRLLGRLHGRGAAPRWHKFSPDGRYLALGYRDRMWRIWDLDEQRLVREMQILGGYDTDTRYGYALHPFDFAPDGKSFAVLTPAGSVQVFPIDAEEPSQEFGSERQPRRLPEPVARRLRASGALVRAPARRVKSAAPAPKPRKIWYSPDGSRLALAYGYWRRPSIHIYDLQNRRPGPSFRVHSIGWIAGCAWSPDGRRIACGVEARKLGEITIWDTSSGQRVATLEGHRNSVRFLSFTPDGRWLISSSWDGTTCLWDLVRGTEALRIPGDSRYLSRDGTWLSIRHSDSRLSIARLAVPREVLPVTGRAEFASRDGRLLAVPSPREVRLIELESSRRHARLAANNPTMCRFAPDASCLFVADRDGIWRCPIGTDRTGHASLRARGERRGESGVPEGRRAEAADVWDDSRLSTLSSPLSAKSRREDGRSALHLPSPNPVEFGRKTRLTAQSHNVDRNWCEPTPDGRFFAFADDENEVCILNADSGEVVNRVRHRGASYVSFHPHGKWIATGAYLGPEIRVWDCRSGTLVTKFWSGNNKHKGVMKFSPDGNWLVAHSHDRYCFFQTGSWSQRRVITDPAGAGREGRIAFRPDGRLVALTTSLNCVSLYRLPDFSLLAAFQHQEQRDVLRIDFSPDGNYLLAQTVQMTNVWDLGAVRQHLRAMDLDWR